MTIQLLSAHLFHQKNKVGVKGASITRCFHIVYHLLTYIPHGVSYGLFENMGFNWITGMFFCLCTCWYLQCYHFSFISASDYVLIYIQGVFLHLLMLS